MKSILIIPLALLFHLGFNNSPNSGIKPTLSSFSNKPDSIHVSADFVSKCTNNGCVISSKAKAKNFKNSIVLYKINNKWLSESDRSKKDQLIDAYKGSNITLWHGNVKIEGIDVKDPKDLEVVALY